MHLVRCTVYCLLRNTVSLLCNGSEVIPEMIKWTFSHAILGAMSSSCVMSLAVSVSCVFFVKSSRKMEQQEATCLMHDDCTFTFQMVACTRTPLSCPIAEQHEQIVAYKKYTHLRSYNNVMAISPLSSHKACIPDTESGGYVDVQSPFHTKSSAYSMHFTVCRGWYIMHHLKQSIYSLAKWWQEYGLRKNPSTTAESY